MSIYYSRDIDYNSKKVEQEVLYHKVDEKLIKKIKNIEYFDYCH